jgi:hypothetical protein
MKINMLNQMSRQITSNHEPEVGSNVRWIVIYQNPFLRWLPQSIWYQYDIVKTSTVQHGTIGCHQQGQWVVHHNTKENLVSWWCQLAMLMAMAGDHSTWLTLGYNELTMILKFWTKKSYPPAIIYRSWLISRVQEDYLPLKACYFQGLRCLCWRMVTPPYPEKSILARLLFLPLSAF